MTPWGITGIVCDIMSSRVMIFNELPTAQKDVRSITSISPIFEMRRAPKKIAPRKEILGRRNPKKIVVLQLGNTPPTATML